LCKFLKEIYTQKKKKKREKGRGKKEKKGKEKGLSSFIQSIDLRSSVLYFLYVHCSLTNFIAVTNI
jgi:hypothetical protein